ncbi:TPA: AbrB/MazE/SpoVT family DNA-binding domain-containing protein [Candidatus Woesearchaeota archaeon]|nr:AbrB/MazE/SpoVT family DNA-binding domain-containing protein [Candidatus Woesearchaeota archaeon]
MQVFETTPKQWGNSLGITIPKEVVDKEHLSTGKTVRVLVVADRQNELRKVFGSLKLKMPTQKAMEEIDRGYYD